MISKKPSKAIELIKYSTFFIAIIGSLFACSTYYHGTPAISPVKNGTIRSGFGYRLHPVLKEKKLHQGVDFSVPIGTPVYATANGRVSLVDTTQGSGIHLIIRNSEVYETHFSHLSEILVTENQKVKKGEIIAKVGNTGLSTAPHLHYEIIENGKHIDPTPFLSKE